MMSNRTRVLIGIAAAVALIVVMVSGWFAYAFFQTGFSAKAEPSALEILLARQARHLAIPFSKRNTANPIPASPDLMVEARRHFADHCATCHANNGSGDTGIGRGLYPKAPDMRLAATQDLTDGELFYIIEHGVRFTGMPAWGDGTPETATGSWHLVHFLRRLPHLTEQELADMEALNPKSPEEWREEEEIRRFLEGEGRAPKPAPKPTHKHGDRE